MKAAGSQDVPCPLFQEMTPQQRKTVLALFECEKYPAGETILRQGLSIQILWVITEGRCEVVKTATDGHERVLALLEEGAVFGEMSFFQPAPHSASIRTVTPVEVLRLSRKRFDELAERSPGASFRLAANTAGILAERLRKMDDWVCELLDRPEASARQREEWHEFRSKLYTDWDF